MDFEFIGEQKMVQETARRLMEREIIPLVDEYDKTKALCDRQKLKVLLDKIAAIGRPPWPSRSTGLMASLKNIR